MIPFARKQDEDIVDYLIRLYSKRTEYGLSNKDVAELLNKAEDTEFDESRWRKIYQAWVNYFEGYVERNFSNAQEYNKHAMDVMEMKRIDTEKMMNRLRDQVREYKKMIRSMGRFEHLVDVLKEEVSALPYDYEPVQFAEVTDRETIILLSDWHIGTEFYGRFNEYNIDIARERIQTITEKIKNYLKKNPSKVVHVANLGDMISGVIHVSTKIQAEENVVKQIKIASEELARLIREIAPLTERVEFYNIVGNHGRISPQKDATASNDENFEKLIPWHLEIRLAEVPNLTIHEDMDGLCEAEVQGQKVVFGHGDFDRKANVVTRLPQLLGYVPDYIFLGHTHSHYSDNKGITTVVVNPSLIGADDYATQGRFGHFVGQTIVGFEDSEFGVDREIKVITA